MRYVRVGSLSWWAGAGLIGLGVLAAVRPEIDGLAELMRVAAVLMGSSDPSPAALIVTGLGIIGLRDAIARLPKG